MNLQTFISTQTNNPQDLTEDEAMRLLHEITNHFGWAGTMFTRADAEQAWNAERDPDGIGPEQEMPDEVWNDVLDTWAWRKGLTDRLVEVGWELVADAISDILPKESE